MLHIIAEELSEGCNPETLKKVAEFFVEQEQFDKAVDLLIRSNRVCYTMYMYMYTDVHVYRISGILQLMKTQIFNN